MKKSYYLGVALMGLLVTTIAVGSISLAATGDPNATSADNNPSLPKADRQIVRQAIIDNNYDAWKTAMTERVTALRARADKLESSITPANFETMKNIQQLIKDGKIDEAKKLMEESGLGGFGPHLGGMGMKRGLKMMNRQSNP